MSNEIDPKEMWSKFQLRSSSLAILSPPRSFQPYINSIKKDHTVLSYIAKQTKIPFVLSFVTTTLEIETLEARITPATKGVDSLVWFAYPNSTSKNYKSDIVDLTAFAPMINSTFVAVKKIDIDDDWTCIRFKRSEYIKEIGRDENGFPIEEEEEIKEIKEVGEFKEKKERKEKKEKKDKDVKEIKEIKEIKVKEVKVKEVKVKVVKIKETAKSRKEKMEKNVQEDMSAILISLKTSKERKIEEKNTNNLSFEISKNFSELSSSIKEIQDSDEIDAIIKANSSSYVNNDNCKKRKFETDNEESKK